MSITPEKLDPLGLDLAQTVLIEASAGTGKTYTITTLVTRLIAQGYPLDSILVVTFTEAAAAELKVRIRGRLAQCLAALDDPASDGDELVELLRAMPDQDQLRTRLNYAVITFDTACIATIHSFCSLMLKTHTFESGARFEMELVTDNAPFFDQVCMDFFMTRINNQDALFLSFLAKRGITPENWAQEFKQLVGKPQLKRIPEEVDFSPVWDDYREITGRMGDMLNQSLDEIVDTVLQKTDSVGLNGNAYRKNLVPKWLVEARDLINRQGKNTIFQMSESGDSLFRFTTARMASKTLKGKGAPSHEFFDLCDRLTELYLEMEANIPHLKLAFLEFYDQELARFKSSQGKCFFDDLINDLANALAPDSPDREGLVRAAHTSYQACLIDEFQDTDPRQYQIFSTLFQGTNQVTEAPMPFFMIGDPKQAIYAFRGGDIFAYLEAAAASDAAYTLDKNYRSSPAMVGAVNDLFDFSDNPFLFDKIGFVRVGTPEVHQNRLKIGETAVPPFQFSMVGDVDAMAAEPARQHVADLLVKQILWDLSSEMALSPLNGEKEEEPRPLNLGDMAVLVRSHHQAELVKEALGRAGIPAYMSRTGSVFESSQARELHDILTAIQDPARSELIRGALCTSVFGFRPQDLAHRDEAFMGGWQDRFQNWKESWEKRGFVFMLQDLLYSEQALLREGCAVDDRGLTNFHHLMEIISQAALDQHLSMYFLLKWFKKQLGRPGQGDKAQELRLESDGRAVAIVTIHKSKGLEYPVVYLPFLWNASSIRPGGQAVLFHDPEQGNAACVDFRSSEEQAESRECLIREDQAEQRRLLYVALTRASALCRVFWGNFKGAEQSSLGQILCHNAKFKGKQEEKSAQIQVAFDQALESLSQSPEGGIGVVDAIFDGAVPAFQGDDDQAPELIAPPTPPRVDRAFQISSFSALTRDMGGQHGHGQGEIPGEKTGVDAAILDETVVLADFPKGAGAGDFFHGVMEEVDFTGSSEALKQCTADNLARFGFKGQGLESMSVKAFQDLLATPLNDGERSFCLNQIPNADRFTELEFYFSAKEFRLGKLALALEEDPETQAYGKQLIRSVMEDSTQFSGFIKGFVDLVVRFEGRWYILDYKSNFLGTTYGDYHRSAVDQAMADHHYILQYHLYLIALHRYLAHRIPEYDYDRDFGGVFYLFLRGMHPRGGESGIYFSRPAKNRIVGMLDD